MIAEHPAPNENKILVFPDTPVSLAQLSDILNCAGFSILTLAAGKSVMQEIHNNSPALVLMDVDFPGMDFSGLCGQLKRDARLSLIPVIFICASGDDPAKISGFRSGCTDIITRPFLAAEVVARVRPHLAQKLHPGLMLLNMAGVRVNDVKSGEDLYADIASLLKNLAGGMVSTVSAYRSADKSMHVMHAEIEHNLVSDLFLALGRRHVTKGQPSILHCPDRPIMQKSQKISL